MQELTDYDPAKSDPSVVVAHMPKSKSGWANSYSIDYVHWDVTGCEPFVTMDDIANSGWVNQVVKLEAFDNAGYSWERFSYLVGRFGATQFGIWMSKAANEALEKSSGRDVPPDKMYSRAAQVLATEIDTRSYSMHYFNIPVDEADELLIFSFVLAPCIQESFDWLGAIEVKKHFGIGNAILLSTGGYDMQSLIRAARNRVDVDIMISAATSARL